MKVLFLTNVPAPYRVDFFNELGKLCELTVLFEKKTSDERDQSWKNYRFEYFNGIFLKGKSIDVDSAVCPEVVRYLKPGAFDHIIVTNFLSPTGMMAILWMRMHRMEYWLESDGGFAKDGVGIKEKIKTYFIKGAKGYFSTAAEHDKYYMQYGAPADKIYRYPYTSLKREDVFLMPATDQERQALREKYGIHTRRVLLAVGQFIPRKGFDILLRVMPRLTDRDVQLLLIGGKPTPEYISFVQEETLTNVKFVEFVDSKTLKEYMRLSDVFVHPTREDIWGLVVSEAMAAGLPVITTEKCIAGLALIRSDTNGMIIPTEDVDALEKAVAALLDTPDLEKMGCANIERSNEYTIERMVQTHINILDQ